MGWNEKTGKKPSKLSKAVRKGVSTLGKQKSVKVNPGSRSVSLSGSSKQGISATITASPYYKGVSVKIPIGGKR
jgi:hypothetical protein